jgi:hypothetical protein
MSIRRTLAWTLVLAMAVTSLPGSVLSAVQNNTGTISGKATSEAKKPYTDYSVQLFDVVSSAVAGTVPLDTDGHFKFNNVALSTRLQVQLVKQGKVVCTEGPYMLSQTTLSRTDVNINCGGKPAALLLAAGGAAAAIAIGVRSPSK